MGSPHRTKQPKQASLIKKEIIVGVLAVALGIYNILSMYGYINLSVKIPQLIGNILLIISGFFLWSMAWKLGRYKYHTKHMF